MYLVDAEAFQDFACLTKKKYLIDVQAFQDFAFLQPSDFRFSLEIRSQDTDRQTDRQTRTHNHTHTHTITHAHTQNTHTLSHTNTHSQTHTHAHHDCVFIYRVPVSGAQISFQESRWSGWCVSLSLHIQHKITIYVHTGCRFPKPK